MATSKELARLEGRIDSVRSEIGYLAERLDYHIDETATHTRSWLKHKGTLFGALGPLLVGIFEVVRHFL